MKHLILQFKRSLRKRKRKIHIRFVQRVCRVAESLLFLKGKTIKIDWRAIEAR